MKRDSFVFYRSFFEAIQNMPKKHQVALYQAIFEYALDDKQPTLSNVPEALWKIIRPQLDASVKRYENAKKGAKYGKLGGRPKKDGDEKKPLKGYETKTLNSNSNSNSNVNSNLNSNSNSNLKGADSGTEETEKTEPKLEEVVEEIESKGYKVDAKEFFTYYSKAGWRTANGETIKDWKALLRVWNLREREPARQRGKNAFNRFEQREYYEGDLEEMLLDLGGIAIGQDDAMAT